MLNVYVKPHREYLKALTPEEQVLFVMMRIIPERSISQKRAKIAVALVVDTSGSMYEDDGTGMTKIDRAIESAQKLVKSNYLESDDQVSVIQFSDFSNILLASTPVKKQNELVQAISSLNQYSGGTEMDKGLKNALKEMRKVPKEFVKKIILLTDGMTVKENDCEQTAKVLADENVQILSIGIGVEYNQDLLMKISDITKGKHLHLSKPEELDKFFLEGVKEASKEIVTNLHLNVETVRGVVLKEIHKSYPNILEIPLDTPPYKLGNIQSDDYTIFIMKFVVSDLVRPVSRAKVAKIELYGTTSGSKIQQELLGTYEIVVSFTDREDLWRQLDPEVMDYISQLNTSSMIQEASKLVAKGEIKRATQILQQAKQMTMRIGNSAISMTIDKALTELQRNGTISEESLRTMRASSKTQTVKSKGTAPVEGLGLSENEIRKVTGT